jgi:hypothetical protein
MMLSLSGPGKEMRSAIRGTTGVNEEEKAEVKGRIDGDE